MIPAFLAVAKPRGWSSGRVLGYLKGALGIGRMGHWGTLDPDASGVLPVAVGQATRLLPYLDPWPKVYLAVVRLGIETDSLDLVGEVIAEAPVPPLSRESVEAALASLTGEILQVPPAYAAVRADGVRAYKRARRGEKVELAARPVTIKRLELLSLDPPDLVLRVTCGPGTYVRSIARDLGLGLSTRGTLARLVRTRSGPFRLRDARSPWRFDTATVSSGGPGVVPVTTALANLRTLPLSPGQASLLLQGKDQPLPDGFHSASGDAVLLLDEGQAVGVGRIAPGGWVHPETMLSGEGISLPGVPLRATLAGTKRPKRENGEGGADS